MERIVEPELMDDEAQARAYAEADFEEPNARFVALCREFVGSLPRGAAVLDLGCGPGDITLRIAAAHPAVEVHGLDGSAAMLAFGRAALDADPTLRARVTFIDGLVPEATLPRARYEAVVSNSLLHHLHDPGGLWRMIRERGAPGAPVLVMDLMRPPSAAAAQALVDEYAATEPEVLRRDFYNSLLAAFEPGEVREQLEAAGLGHLSVEEASDRHLLVRGRI
ncbi:MAG: class I SAM-dependent methyltransferase [Gammaproteobacteria bacterium]